MEKHPSKSLKHAFLSVGEGGGVTVQDQACFKRSHNRVRSLRAARCLEEAQTRTTDGTDASEQGGREGTLTVLKWENVLKKGLKTRLQQVNKGKERTISAKTQEPQSQRFLGDTVDINKLGGTL